MQRRFQRKTGVQDYSAVDGVSPGICHSVARERIIEPGDFIQATDSHTCMGGSLGALAYGVGATEYAALVHAGFTFVEVPESIRFELAGELPAGRHGQGRDALHPGQPRAAAGHARPRDGVRRARACARSRPTSGPRSPTWPPSARPRRASCEADEETLAWIAARRPGRRRWRACAAKVVAPDPGADVRGRRPRDRPRGRSAPWWRRRAIPRAASPPTRPTAPTSTSWARCRIDIAYGGSCTAGKEVDLDLYARVMREALAAGRRVKDGRRLLHPVRLAERRGATPASKGYVDVFEKTGVRVIHPGCGACIGCGPGRLELDASR